MISAISFGNKEKYVSEATIFTVEESKKAAKVIEEAVKRDLEAMKQTIAGYGYSSPFINIPNIGKVVSTKAIETYAESYARSHGNFSPVSSKL